MCITCRGQGHTLLAHELHTHFLHPQSPPLWHWKHSVYCLVTGSWNLVWLGARMSSGNTIPAVLGHRLQHVTCGYTQSHRNYSINKNAPLPLLLTVLHDFLSHVFPPTGHACMASTLYRRECLTHVSVRDAPSWLICPLTCGNLQLCMDSKPHSTWNSGPHVMHLFMKQFQRGESYGGSIRAHFTVYHKSLQLSFTAL